MELYNFGKRGPACLHHELCTKPGSDPQKLLPTDSLSPLHMTLAIGSLRVTHHLCLWRIDRWTHHHLLRGVASGIHGWPLRKHHRWWPLLLRLTAAWAATAKTRQAAEELAARQEATAFQTIATAISTTTTCTASTANCTAKGLCSRSFSDLSHLRAGARLKGTERNELEPRQQTKHQQPGAASMEPAESEGVSIHRNPLLVILPCKTTPASHSLGHSLVSLPCRGKAMRQSLSQNSNIAACKDCKDTHFIPCQHKLKSLAYRHRACSQCKDVQGGTQTAHSTTMASFRRKFGSRERTAAALSYCQTC